MIGTHAAGAPAPVRARDARRRALREGRMAEPRRVGEGPRGRADDSRGRSLGQADAGHASILDATSGNTGIAYAMVGAARGYTGEAVRAREREPRAQADSARARRRARADQSARRHRRRHPRGAPAAARAIRIATSIPTSTATTRNWRAHYDTTAPEIIEQTSGRLTHFVAGLGTSGTFVGTGRRLRQVQPVDQADFVSARLAVPRPRRAEAHGVGDRARRSTIRRSPTRICAIDTERAYRHGAPPGARGRACWPAFRRAPRSRRCSTSRGGSSAGIVVTVFPDGAEKYLSESVLDASMSG